MTTFQILLIIFIHWYADFLMQDEKWAITKNKSVESLLKHTTMYSFCWLMALLVYFAQHLNFEYLGQIMQFVIITFVFHTLTDYFTSKIVSKKFTKGQYGSSIPNIGGFTIIGIDQVLHYIQLFITFQIIK